MLPSSGEWVTRGWNRKRETIFTAYYFTLFEYEPHMLITLF